MVALAISVAASNKKDKEPKPVKLFGVGISLTDSAAFITEIISFDSLFLNANGFLDNEAEYSLQLKLYLANTLQMPDKTCTVFYDDNLKDLEKEMGKVKSKLKEIGYPNIVTIAKSDFTFKPYIEQHVGQQSMPQEMPQNDERPNPGPPPGGPKPPAGASPSMPGNNH